MLLPKNVLYYSLISMRLIYYFDTWAIISHGIGPVLLKICTDLHRCDQKIVLVIVWGLKLFRNNDKNNFVITSVQICANLQKSWNNTISIDGSIIENMDLSHINSAVLSEKKITKFLTLKVIPRRMCNLQLSILIWLKKYLFCKKLEIIVVVHL
jgi:hypothetical protein